MVYGQVSLQMPIVLQTKGIIWPIFADEFGMLFVKSPEEGHALYWGVREGSQRGSWRNDAEIAVRTMACVASHRVARGQSPEFGPVAFVIIRIVDAVGVVDEGVILVELPVVGVGVA